MKKKLCQKLNFTDKTSKIAFVPHFGVTYTVRVWLVGKLVVDFLLVLLLIELFRQLSRLSQCERMLFEVVVCDRE